MMLAEDLDDGPVREHFRDKQPVLVRVKRGAGQAPLYVPGIILERRPKAAKVRTDHWINYMFYSDLQPDPSREKPAKPLATIADIMPRLPALPPAPPPPEVEGMRPPAVLMTAEQVQKSQKWAEEIREEEEMKKKRKPYTAKTLQSREVTPHDQTAIGAIVREARHRAGIGQGVLAKKLGMTDQGALSRLELGKQLPPDEILIKLSEVFPELDLADLQKARDKDAHRYPRQAKILGIPLTPKSNGLAQVGAKPTMVVHEADAFEFVAALCQVAPMPSDPSRRKAWLKLAKELRAVSG